MNDLKDPAIKLFYNTIESITGSKSIAQAKETAQLARGYLVGIHGLGIINISQYGAMTNLLNVAVDAVQQRTEKAAPGVISTESGLPKAGCPVKDSGLSHTPSISVLHISVKRGGEPGC
jgi:hypothetical protein